MPGEDQVSTAIDGLRRWQAVTASVRGAQHDRTGLPNQDAVRILDVDGAVAGLVAAVADGHGGSRYVRSDIGSRLAVEIACAVGAEVLAQLGAAPDGRAVRRAVESTVAPVVVARWRDAVLGDHRNRPFTVEERTRGGASLDGDPPIAYGCTLIVAVLGPSWGAIVQIGDGDALVVDADGRTSSPVPTDDRLVGGETTSLCLPDAASDARIAVLDAPLPELVVLTSDGYGNSFASSGWRQEAGTGLSEAVHRDGLHAVADRLPAWLGDSAVAGGDDVTMALVLGAPAPMTPTTPTTPTTPVATTTPIPTPPEPAPTPAAPVRRSRLALGAAVAVLAAGIGGGLGWFARGPSETTSAAGSTPDVTSNTTVPVTPPPTAAVPAETAVAAPPRYAAVTKNGVVVTFQSDPTPDPQVLVGTSGLTGHVAPKDPSGRRWTASSKTVKGVRPQGPPVTITLPISVQDGDLVLVGPTLWVLSSDGSRLWSVDTSEAKPTAQPAAGWPVPAPSS